MAIACDELGDDSRALHLGYTAANWNGLGLNYGYVRTRARELLETARRQLIGPIGNGSKDRDPQGPLVATGRGRSARRERLADRRGARRSATPRGRQAAARLATRTLEPPSPPSSVLFGESERAVTLERLSVLASTDGAPFATIDGDPIDRPISISHSHGLALCVVGDPRATVGCDLELIVPHTPAFITDYFTDLERRRIEAAADTARARITTLYWSAKESALKAVRLGLPRIPRSAEVEIGDPSPTIRIMEHPRGSIRAGSNDVRRLVVRPWRPHPHPRRRPRGGPSGGPGGPRLETPSRSE